MGVSRSISANDDLPPRAALMAQTVKNLPTTRETQVQSLGQQDPLEKETATHSSVLAWRIPRTEEPGGLQSTGWQRVRYDLSDLARTHSHKCPSLLGNGTCEWLRTELEAGVQDPKSCQHLSSCSRKSRT